MAVLTETCLSGQISPVALLTLGHFLSYEDCTSEPPHHLRSPEAVSSRTMAGDHCCSTCYLNSSPCHPTVCCWCTIPPLGGSTLQCHSSSGLQHSQVWVVQCSGMQYKGSYIKWTCLLWLQLQSSICDCGCLVRPMCDGQSTQVLLVNSITLICTMTKS